MEVNDQIQWSPKQQAVFEFIEHGKGSAVIVAVAGSGKSTTIVYGCTRIPSSQAVLFLAFNKSIADELTEKVPSHVTARTFHSLGSGAVWLALKNAGKKMTTDGSKVAKIVDACTDSDKLHDRLESVYQGMPTLLTDDENKAYKACICKLVSLAKQYGLGHLTNEDLWPWFVDNFDIEPSVDGLSAHDCIPQAKRILHISTELAKRTGIIDFDDMIYLPLLWNLRVKAYDWVFIDEAQDTNPVRRALAKKALRPGGRLVAVGDPHQAIYGFTGANSDALDLIKREFNAVELPLTVSYRCPVNVVEAAREFVSHIEPAPTAPAGLVETHEELPFKDVQAGDAILCRFNAPLVSTAYKFIADGRGARILGREIGEGLINLLDRVGGSTLEKLEGRLEKWREREHDKAMSKGRESKAEAVQDQFDCLSTIIDNLPEEDRSVGALKMQIAKLFSDQENGGCVMLSTVHKYKGRESDRVWLIGRDDMPSRYARQAWQFEQEINLLYVAYTRAKQELHICA